MTKINPNFVVGVNSVNTRTPSKRSPAKGESQFVPGLDRLQLGMTKVSTEEALKILVERVTSYILDAMREVGIDSSRGPAIDVPLDASPEVVGQRIFDFAVRLFEDFRASQAALDGAEAREHFARVISMALGKGVSETQNLLHELKVFLSRETSNKMEKIASLVVKLLDDFVTEGIEKTQAGDRSLGSSTAGARAPERGQNPGFVPRPPGGGEVARAPHFHAQGQGRPLPGGQEVSSPVTGPEVGRAKVSAPVQAQAPWPEHGQQGGAPSKAAGESIVKGASAAEGRPSGPFGGGPSSPTAQVPKAEAASEGRAAAEGGRLLLGGEQPSAEQVVRMISERVISNMEDLMGEMGVEASPLLYAESPSGLPPEAAVQRVYDFMARVFDSFQQHYTFASDHQGREQFAALIGEAISRGISEARVFLHSLRIVLSEEAASSVVQLRSLFAKMVDEFVAEGLRSPSGKLHTADLYAARLPHASPEQGRGADLVHREHPAMEASVPSARSPSLNQAQFIPPESTVLAMTKKLLSRKMYALSEQEASPQVAAYRPKLPALLGTLFSMAVILSYPWELAHLLFYRWWDITWTAVTFTCFKAALGDGLLILGLYGLGCALFKHREWVLNPGFAGYSFLAFSGMAVAVAIEWHAVVWSRWAYSSLMPLVPVVGVGLYTVLQLMVLPPLVAYVTQLWLERPK
jgi:hypothetical protein